MGSGQVRHRPQGLAAGGEEQRRKGLQCKGTKLSEAKTGKPVGAGNKSVEMRAFSTRGSSVSSSGDMKEATWPAAHWETRGASWEMQS